MPVKPDNNSKHIQLVINSGGKFHETLLVAVKNSDVLVQPLNTPDLHITMHSLEGTNGRKNSHLRVDSGQNKKYKSKVTNGKKFRNGKLVEWNRNISPAYESALELRFHSSLANRNKAPVEYDFHLIQCDSGVVHVNFWFTSHNKDELERYFESTGVTLVMFENIPRTEENFALTYNVSPQSVNTDKIVHTSDFYEIETTSKDSEDNDTKRTEMIFGLCPEHSQLILFQ